MHHEISRFISNLCYALVSKAPLHDVFVCQRGIFMFFGDLDKPTLPWEFSIACPNANFCSVPDPVQPVVDQCDYERIPHKHFLKSVRDGKAQHTKVPRLAPDTHTNTLSLSLSHMNWCHMDARANPVFQASQASILWCGNLTHGAGKLGPCASAGCLSSGGSHF